jgi:acetylornithine deacetylase/succinyl-diaminopimelate desuccinylase-like protein
VPRATARIKFRTSARVDRTPILLAVRDAAARAGLALHEDAEGTPPDLPASHPLIRLCTDLLGVAALTAPYGTDASELQSIAPCVVLGPGDIGVAHTPREAVSLAALASSVPAFMQLAQRVADM